ncbi:MAG: thymidine kinase [Sulfobacillus benefaciens]|uniref:Thymidine kinase n=1 Tax=Sulfobacillus benefaciens TaxID=453960 RepID=A0A2T2XF61_9FIRM|nr:MAG: thymidine kinase [Sulfobacillus benefaciens]
MLVTGNIKVITGEMFSGKSKELSRLIERALIADLTVDVFYPVFSSRDSSRDIERRIAELHGSLTIVGVPDGNAQALITLINPVADVVAIDEAQFFTHDLVDVVKKLRHDGKRVLIAGLDLDYQENPFGCMGALMCVADDVMKVHAVCTACKKSDAFISYRLTDESGQVVVGESNYTALCVECYDHVMMEKQERTTDYQTA